MVAIVGGEGLGLFNGSLTQLNGYGSSGRSRIGSGSDGAFVNVVNGNLVIQGRDDYLAATGADWSWLRTYNSRGIATDELGGVQDNWLMAHQRRLEISTVLGLMLVDLVSGVTRVSEDGHRTVFSGIPLTMMLIPLTSTEGEGAHDTLTADALAGVVLPTTKFTYTEGSTGTVEVYDYQGRLESVRDRDGNVWTFTYTGGRVTSMTTTRSGQSSTTFLDYNGATNELTQLRVVSDGVTTTRVRYTYTAGRLSDVKVDLGNITDATADDLDGSGTTQAYNTHYEYDTNGRVNKITQGQVGQTTPESELIIEYYADGRVSALKTWLSGTGPSASYRVESFTYDDINRRTDVVDELGTKVSYFYDTAGRLTSVQNFAAGNPVARSSVSYAYDASSNVSEVRTRVDGSTELVVKHTYDANGNLTLSQDALGNTVSRTYNALNQILTETQYLVPDGNLANSVNEASSPLTTYFAYDTEQHLRFVQSADGRVTEHTYDDAGSRLSTTRFTGVRRTGAVTFAESDFVTWRNGHADKTQREITAYAYDFRGQLTTSTRYTQVDSAGVPIAASGNVTRYIYNTAGELLQIIDPRGSGGALPGQPFVTSYVYDGLGRVRTATDSTGRVTQTEYDAASNSVKTIFAHDLVTTRVYSKAGELISEGHTLQSAPAVSLGATIYTYDDAGRLRMTTDPNGSLTHCFYDSRGLKIGEVNPEGEVTEWVYNDAGQMIQTIRYSTRLSPSDLSDLVSGNTPTAVQFSEVRPAAAPLADRTAYSVYDGAGRLAYQLVADTDEGNPTLQFAVTEFVYDGASRLVQQKAYSARMPNSVALTLTAIGTWRTSNANAAADRVTRTLYDADGLAIGVIDAAGYLTENAYDASGHLVTSTTYANLAQVGTGNDVATYRPATNAADQTARLLYSLRGEVVARIDAEGFLTEYAYDATGNLTTERRYSGPVVYGAGATLASLTAQALAATPAGQVRSRTNTSTYDALNRVTQEVQSAVNAAGTSVDLTTRKWIYDSLSGFLIRTEVAAGSGGGLTDIRGTRNEYDSLGRLTKTMDGEGDNAFGTIGSAAWDQYATKHTYDLAGRRIKTVDPNGAATYYYYDRDDRLRFAVREAERAPTGSVRKGEITGYTYNAFDEVTGVTQYAQRVETIDALGVEMVGGTFGVELIGSNRISAFLGDSNNRVTTTSYTQRGQADLVTDALGFTVNNDYSVFAQKRSQLIDIGATPGSLRRLDTLEYDRRGLLKKRTEDAGIGKINRAWEGLVYDAFGRLEQSKDANGNTWTNKYDRLGRTVEVQDPLGGKRATAYDAWSRTLTTIDAAGIRTRFTYDDTQRAVVTTTDEGVVTTVVNNAHGQQVSVSVLNNGASETTTYKYDRDGRLTEVQLPHQQGTGEKTVNTYDKADNLVSTVDARGTTTTYTYDPSNRVLTRTVDPGAPPKLNLQTKYQYSAFGEAVLVTDPNGDTTETVFDKKGQVAFVVVDTTDNTGGPATRLATRFVYDARGLKLRVSEGLTPTKVGDVWSFSGTTALKVTDYTFDALGARLTERTEASAGVFVGSDYFYDKAGNLTRKQDGVGQPWRYAYDDNGRQIFSIDPLGAVTETVYDGNQRVIKAIQYAQTVSLSGVTDLDDADTWRARITPSMVSDPANRVTYFVRDRDGRTVYEIDAAGAITEYVYDGANQVVDTVRYSKTISLTGLPSVLLPEHVAARLESLRFNQAFTTDASGFTENDPTNLINVSGGRLSLTTPIIAIVPSIFGARSYDLAQGPVTFRSEITTSAAATNRNFTASVSNQTFNSATFKNLGATFLGGSLYATQWINGVAQASVLLGDIKNSTTYVFEAEATSTGVTFYVYEKSTTRAEGFTFQQVSSWNTALSQHSVGQAAGANTTLVDNYSETSVSWKHEFTGNAPGDLTYSADAVSITFSNNALQLTARNAATSSLPAAIGNRIYDLSKSPVLFSSEISTGNANASRNHFVGIQNTIGTVTGTFRGLYAWFLGNQLYALSRVGLVDTSISLGTFDNNKTYVVEVLAEQSTSGVPGATLRVYEKGQPRSTAKTYFQATTWDVARSAHVTVAAPTIVGTATMQVDNLVETPLEAQAGLYDRRTSTVYDKSGRPVFEVDALGYVSENQYDLNGNVVRRIRYPVALEPSTALTIAGLESQRTALNGTAGETRVDTYVYDSANRLRYAIDAVGAVTESRYDAAGRLTQSIRYANPITVSGPPTAAPSLATVQALIVVDAAKDQTTINAYDGAGRLTSVTDAEGEIESYSYDVTDESDAVIGSYADKRTAFTNKLGDTWNYVYDGAGRMIEEITPEVEVTSVSETTVSGMAGAFQSIASADGKHVYVTGKTGNSLAVFERDAESGRLTFVTSYTDGVGGIQGLNGAGFMALSKESATENRFLYVTGANGNTVTVFERDDETGLLTWVQTLTDGQGGIDGLAGAQGIAVTDDRVFVVSSVDDALAIFTRNGSTGQMTASQVFKDGVGTVDGLNGARAVVLSTDTRRDVYVAGADDNAVASFSRNLTTGLYSYSAVVKQGVGGFDGLTGAANLVIDLDNAYLRVLGPGSNAIATVVRNTSSGVLTFGSRTVSGWMGLPSAFGGAPPSVGFKGATGIARSADGLKLLVTSPVENSVVVINDYKPPVHGTLPEGMLGASSVSFSADSKEVYVTSAGNGGLTVFRFDQSGELRQQQSVVQGDVVLRPETTNSRVSTQFEYDALGNLTRRIEAAGTGANQRATAYEYEQRGIQARTTHDEVGVFNADDDEAGGYTGRHEVIDNLLAQTWFDAFGQAIVNRDAGGDFSYKLYDSKGRVTAEVDAERYLTVYGYDAFDNIVSTTRFATRILDDTLGSADALITFENDAFDAETPASVTDSASRTAALGAYARVAILVQQLVAAAPATAKRTLETAYDKRNSQVTVRQPEVEYYLPQLVGSPAQGTARPTVAYQYNAFAEQIRQSELRNPLTREYITTQYAYDRAGRRTRTVDTFGYLTDVQYDALGRVARSIEYAALQPGALTNLAGYTAVATQPGSTITTNVGIGYDRRVAFTYDRLDRQLSETRENTQFAVHSGGLATLTARGDVTRLTEYDSVGNVVSQTDETGAKTRFLYDALGREIARAEPERVQDRRSAIKIDSEKVATGLSFSGVPSAVTGVTLQYRVAGSGGAYTSVAASSLTGVPDSNNYRRALFGSNPLTATGQYEVIMSFTGPNGSVDVFDGEGGPGGTLTGIVGVSSTGLYSFSSNASPVTVRPLSTFKYDALGNRVIETAHEKGVVAAVDSFEPVAGAPADQTTTHRYNRLGWLTSTVDAEGNEEFFSYDAFAQLRKDWRAQTDVLNQKRESATLFEYDRLGRQIGTGEVNRAITYTQHSVASVDTVQAAYNAYGEQVGRGLNVTSGPLQESAKYDAAGRLWQTDEGGVTKVFRHDLQGNVTVELVVPGTVGGTNQGPTAANVASIAAAEATSGVIRTENTYDRLGRLIVQKLPTFTNQAYNNTTSTGVLTTQAAINPIIAQSFDRWGNVLQASDPRNNGSLADPRLLTEYAYNDRNQMIRMVRPIVSVYDQSTTAVQAREEILSFYDVRGMKIGEADGRRITYSGLTPIVQAESASGLNVGNLARWMYDAAGQLVTQLNPVNDPTYHAYDALGRRVKTTDGIGTVTAYTYDHLDQLTGFQVIGTSYVGIGTSKPVGVAAAERYRYDESGNRVAVDDGVGFTTLYRYDTRGRLITSLTPLAQGNLASPYVTHLQYDAQNRQIRETNGNTHSPSIGVTISDFYSTTYDYFGRLIGRTDLSESVHSYQYDALGRISLETTTSVLQAVGPPFAGTHTTLGGTRTEWTYYQNGWTKQIAKKNTAGTITYSRDHFAYDALGNRTQEASDALAPQQTYTHFSRYNYTFDALGRFSAMSGRSTIATTIDDTTINHYYDISGNRRRVMGTMSGSSQDFGFAYDEADRVKVRQGILSGGQIVVGNTQGEEYTYDRAGNRIMERFREGNSTDVYLHSTYDGAHRRLTLARSNSTALPPSTSGGYTFYDRAGRIANINDDLGSGTTSTYAYNANGWLLAQSSGFGSSQTNISFTPSVYSSFHQSDYTLDPGHYDAVGNNRQYFSDLPGTSNNDATYTTEYLRGESGYLDGRIHGLQQDNDSVTTILKYDPYGNNNSVEETGKATRFFAYSAEGKATAMFRGVPPSITSGQLYFYSNGQVLGDAGSANGTHFDAPYQLATEQYVAPGLSRYVVRSGDTLQTIAALVYGDATLWYLIADANGLSSDPPAGTSITIPPATADTKNTSNVFKPYNVAEIIGDITPDFPPPPPPKKKCGGLATVIIVVAAAVAAVVTGGAAASALPAALSASAGGLGAAAGAGIAAAAGAAAGSVVSQAAGIALGVQDGFSFSAVAKSALAGGLTGGIAQGLNLNVSDAGFSYGNVARGAAQSALGQGASIALGLQDRFSWANVAAAAVSSGLTQRTGKGSLDRALGIGNPQLSFRADLVQGLSAGLINRTVSVALSGGGKIDLKTIAADAFGNAIGNSIVNALKPAPVPQEVQQLGSEGVKDYERARANGLDQQAATLLAQDAAEARYAAGGLPPSGGLVFSPFGLQTPDRLQLNNGGEGNIRTFGYNDYAPRAPFALPDSTSETQGDYRYGVLVPTPRNGLDSRYQNRLRTEGSEVLYRGMSAADFEQARSNQGRFETRGRNGYMSPSLEYVQGLETSTRNPNLDLRVKVEFTLSGFGMDAIRAGAFTENGPAAARYPESPALRDRGGASVADIFTLKAENRGATINLGVGKNVTGEVAANVYEYRVVESGVPSVEVGAGGYGVRYGTPQEIALQQKIGATLGGLGKGLTVVGVATDSYSLGTAINESIDQGSVVPAAREATRIAGGWTGAVALGQVGATTGATIGAFTGPLAPVAVPALSFTLGLGAAVYGYYQGSNLAQSGFDSAYYRFGSR